MIADFACHFGKNRKVPREKRELEGAKKRRSGGTYMSKVICDVCGTTYPETEAACPICGCAKDALSQTAADGVQGGETGAYTYVKGGRFSKANVKKRNTTGKEVRYAAEPKNKEPKEKEIKNKEPKKQEPDNGANKGLVIVVLVLLLAIVAVLGYIGVRFLLPSSEPTPEQDPPFSSSEEVPSSSDNGFEGPIDVSCSKITLSIKIMELKLGETFQLSVVEKEPADTTDLVEFSSSDENIATVDVSPSGNATITAIADGEVTITVTCGSATEECKVVCGTGQQDTPDVPDDPDPVVPDGFVLELKYPKGFTISERYPNPVSIYKKHDDVAATDITWTVDNPEVATVDEKGVVAAVGKGSTLVWAKIGDQSVSCQVIVSFTPEQQTEVPYKISHTDVTLNIGKDDSFRLNLTDADGVNKEAEWTANVEGYVTISGKNITGVKSTEELADRCVIVSATVDGHTYSCKVRVAQPKAE